ncbi:MAG: response regulator [Rhodocyclales bacterium]|nr:response regulator [Rhodocyclales bacterium]
MTQEEKRGGALPEVPAVKDSGPTPRPAVPDADPACILVVDDNPGKLESLLAVVANMGLTVVTATSGREALRQLLQRDFAVVLLDVNMPTMGGFETASLIHGRPRSAHTPIIFVTAEAGSEAERSQGYTLGAVDYIYSPVIPAILRAKVQVFVDLFHLNRRLEQQAQEIQHHAEEISRQNLQLEAASRLKSEFLASMSHELRTPLNAIIGFSEVLKDGLLGTLSAEQQRYIGEIFNSGQHLLSLINDILDLSKIEAGRMSLDPERLEVATLLQASLNIVREQALKHRIKLKLDIHPGPAHLVADARKLKQIVYNLLSNAVKFTPDGGHVSLAARPLGRDELQLAVPEGGAVRRLPLVESEFRQFLEIEVCDNGIGITADDLQRLFQTFLQLDASLARGYEGTGLGLALVRRMAELHGGTVAVASAPGQGSCFAVWLPWRQETDAAASAPGAGEMAHGKAGRVLVIEDDDAAAEIIGLYLDRADYRVSRTGSAPEGLQMAAQERPDLIVLDLLLPEMGGWEALERLKENPELAGIPVVIVSVVADRKEGFALGAAEVLQKPVNRESLLASIRQLRPDESERREFTILVVDDDPLAVELMTTHLRELDCRVLHAYGGREGIAIASRTPPDLLILDLMMPQVSGFDVVQALKSDPATAAVPIIVLTAKSIKREDRERLNGYVQRIVEKHCFEHDDFLAEVRRALGRSDVAAGEERK